VKRELNIRCVYECRCDERLRSKTKEFTLLAYTGSTFTKAMMEKKLFYYCAHTVQSFLNLVLWVSSRNVVNYVQASDGILILVDRGIQFGVKFPEFV
jgi:hypothetical protein